jgi:peptidoglycan/xylan/chitin deacetylase (PgdA/CDA1 family)
MAVAVETIPSVKIPAFPRGKRIAFTTSWDDAVVEDRRLVAQMNELGLKGTFNINSGMLAGPSQHLPTGWGERIAAREVANLYRGHEVAIHSRTHPHLTKVRRTKCVGRS